MNALPETQVAGSHERGGYRWTDSLLRALKLWGIGRLALSLWGFVLWRGGLIRPDVGREWLHGLQPAASGVRAALVDLWLRWDTVHYLRIIQSGYGPDERSAYFPLYPLFGKIFGALFAGDNLLGLLAVSNLAAIGCFLLLERLAFSTRSRMEQPSAPVNLVFYPASFFLLAAYPHSLVLLLALASHLTQREGRWFLTCVCGLAAGLTHATALALVVLLAIDAWRRREGRPTWFLAALSPAGGVAAFMAWRAWSGFPTMGKLIGEVWGRSVGFGAGTEGLLTIWVWLLRGWPNLLALLLGLGAVAWAYRSRRYGWACFQAVVLLIPVLSAPGFEPLSGLARYALIGFPLAFALGSWLPPGRLRRLALVPAAGINLFLCGLFLLWGFVG